jgi:PLP dependent protein
MAMAPMETELGERVAAVRAHIAAATTRAGRAPGDVTLIAVTKTVPAAVVRAAHAAGLTVFGENRVREAEEKIRALGDLPGIRWELIGHLQTNKAATAVRLFDRIQSVDSLRLAETLETLEARAAAAGRTLPLLLEINVAGEPSKSGFAPAETLAAARAVAALPHLRPEGLMTVAPIAEQAEDVRPIFRRLRGLRDELRAAVPLNAVDGGWRELSMGMSDDYEVAVEEGATIVRVGRALFGARPTVGARA